MKITHLNCPRCGARLEVNEDIGRFHCDYCGHEAMFERDESKEDNIRFIEEESYAREKGALRAQEQNKRGVILGRIVGLVILVAILGGVLFVLDRIQEAKRVVINPFDYLELTFSGKNGSGEASWKLVDTGDVDSDLSGLDYILDKTYDLYNGDQIAVVAKNYSGDYKMDPVKKIYTVEGLSEYLQDLSALDDDLMAEIHSASQGVLKGESSMYNTNVEEITYEPVKTVFFTNGVDENILFDLFLAHLTFEDGETGDFYMAAKFLDVSAEPGVSGSFSYRIAFTFGESTTYKIDGRMISFVNGFYDIEAADAAFNAENQSGMQRQEREAK